MSTSKTNFLEVVNPDYEANYNSWIKCRDFIEGEAKLKERDLCNFKKDKTSLYLPYTSCEFEPSDIQRYKNYVNRASLFNTVKKTVDSMSAMVFSKDSVSELPESLQYLNINCDGTGIGILEQSVAVFNDLVTVARAALFVDFPVNSEPLTIGSMESTNMRASIIAYKTENILDWGIGSDKRLNFVKLKECTVERDPSNIFNLIEVQSYKVLLLNEEGIYEQRIYSEDDSYTSTIPLDNLGLPFTFIPFFFVGAVDNSPSVDISPILEQVELNIKHYRNSADYEESCFLVGQPTINISGVHQQWIDENYPEGLEFGSRQVVMTPSGSKMEIVQATANTMAQQGMKDKEEQLKMIGARLVSDGGQAETAEAVRIKHGSDLAVLKTITRNETAAYQLAISTVSLFNGVVEDFIFKVNDDFLTAFDPNETTINNATQDTNNM